MVILLAYFGRLADHNNNACIGAPPRKLKCYLAGGGIMHLVT